MAESKEFKTWIKVEAARITGKLSDIDRLMNPANIKIEELGLDGQWYEVPS